MGIKSKDGVVIAVEEKPRKLQISETAHKIFRIDDHIGFAAAGYIPDARSQADNARFFAQSNRIVYDEAVDVETVAKHLADQCQQYTQFGGARPFGVALIIAGVDSYGNSLFLTDPSGTYIAYDAVAIGAGSDQANEFLEKNYKADMSLEDAGALATACIYIASDQKDGTDHIRMSQIKSSTKQFETVTPEQVENYAKVGKQKFPIPNP